MKRMKRETRERVRRVSLGVAGCIGLLLLFSECGDEFHTLIVKFMGVMVYFAIYLVCCVFGKEDRL